MLNILCFCLLSAGIPESVLSRAREVAEFEDKGEPIQPKEDARQGAGPLTLASSEVGLTCARIDSKPCPNTAREYPAG